MRLFIGFLMMVFAAQASFGVDAALSQPEKNLLDAYIAATRSGDANKIRALIHPQNLACMTAENKDYYDTILGKLAHLPVPQHYALKVVAADPATMQQRLALFWGPDATLPVMPKKEITIQYSEKDDSPRKGCRKFNFVADKDVIHMLDVEESNGKASMVVGCIGPKTMESFRQKPKLEAEAAARAKSLAGALSPELKARLAKQLKAGQMISAVKEYQADCKQNMTDSMNVMDQLCEEM